nr:transposase zinc-binding domain-containing protein [unidentified bacterial endosymbiont]
MLTCGTASIGVRRYCCTHSRFFCQSCKSKACTSCDFKATERWVSQQSHILTDCDWQHIIFTMPHLLWPFFNITGLCSTSIRTFISPSPTAGSILSMASAAISSLRSSPWRESGAGLLRHSYDLISTGILPVLRHIRDRKQ